jgi:hypothetical protein
VYVAGGTASHDATNALKNFWSLDLKKRGAKWKQLEPWPGPARMLSVAAARGDSFYVAGGTDLFPTRTANRFARISTTRIASRRAKVGSVLRTCRIRWWPRPRPRR